MNQEENNTQIKDQDGNISKPLLAPVIYWNKLEDIKPNAEEEYLVTNSDGVIRVSYFDGLNWGYLCSVKENIIYWSILPQSPL
ncbi:hypothetical protein PHG11b_5 [Flavobacterium phage 11b]|uniref:hypothetical protein n=1 Tax=Flavobacterium phage 11b TaxID=294631 RepID=UPI0000444123|nr:hypothetical protein PHG11b_5 [Flavobacterium phage 11b]CAH56632.1 hypothetical protein PHG11b_5 [Flavobacterium phage 11b]